jgi:hypothetical protein
MQAHERGFFTEENSIEVVTGKMHYAYHAALWHLSESRFWAAIALIKIDPRSRPHPKPPSGRPLHPGPAYRKLGQAGRAREQCCAEMPQRAPSQARPGPSRARGVHPAKNRL